MAKKVAKKKAPRKPYVQYLTLSKAVGGGLLYPCEKKLSKVGKHQVLVERGQYLNKYGNPIHTVSILTRNGTVAASCKGVGDPALLTSKALKKMGIDTKYGKKSKK